MVATSHSAEVLESRLDRAAMDGRLDEVRRAVAGAGIPVTILVGVEIFLDLDSAARLRRGELFTLNGSRYVLVEPPMDALPLYFDQALFELQTAGYIPVIAHPERNRTVQERPGRLYDWVVRGCYVQISTASVTGVFGRAAARLARLALAHRLAHVLASDAHDPVVRPPALRPACDMIAAIHGQSMVQALIDTHPRAIVQDQAVEAAEPIPLENRTAAGIVARLLGR